MMKAEHPTLFRSNVDITESGEYRLFFSNCEADTKVDYAVSIVLPL